MARPKQFNRTNVLDKAIPVFWMYGLAGASLSQLEQATGLNRSSLYAEFSSKEEPNLQNVSTFVSPKTLSEIVWSYFAGLMLKDNFANTDPQTRSDEIRAFVDLLAGHERNQ